MTLVRFTDLNEFVDELARDPHAVTRKLVRVTQSGTRTSLNLTAVSVVGTAKVISDTAVLPDYDVVRLDIHVGELWGLGHNDDDVRERSHALITQLTAKLEELGFRVAAGVYEEART
jgi:hypothetical protein